MLNDLRFAFRLLLKNPAFTAVAIVAIALGIGANTAVLSLVNALLIRPLPYRDPARIVLMLEHFRAQHLDAIPVSAPEFVDYQTNCRSFDKMAVFQPGTFNFAGGSFQRSWRSADSRTRLRASRLRGWTRRRPHHQ